MKNAYSIAPVGVEEIITVLADVCENSAAHKHCGIAPPHFVINLDAGNGQTTITRFITDTLSKCEIRHFGGMDAFLEYTLDGTMQQLKQIFCDIRTCAVYTNSFEGVIAIDIKALSKCANEEQADFFLKELKDVCRTATVIMYTGGIPSRGEMSIVDKFKTAVRNITTIHLDAYTPDELAYIAESLLDDYGVVAEGTDEFHDALCELMIVEKCQTVKDIITIMEHAVKKADYSDFVPTLSTKQLKAAFSSDYHGEKGEGR